MTLDISWKVEIGDFSSKTDLTDRCTGLSVRQNLGFMQPSSQRCIMTFNNFDGALTPGSSGTYGSTDWFSLGVWLTATVNSTDEALVFFGFINDFDITDDGVLSYVTMTGSDWLTVAARGVYPTDDSDSTALDWGLRVQGLFGSFTYQKLPNLGTTAGSFSEFPTAPPDYALASSTVTPGRYRQAGSTLADTLLNNYQAGVPSVVWATDVIEIVSPSNQALYKAGIVGNTLTRTDADATTFVFTEGIPSAGELPIGSIDRGFNNERIVNSAIISSLFTSNTSTADDAVSQDAYGVKSIYAGSSALQSDAQSLSQAENLVNRFNQIRFSARQLVVSSSQLKSVDAGSKEELAQLLDVGKGLWQVASLEYTPTGESTPTSEYCVIQGRTIRATPEQTVIELDLLPAVDYQSLILDSSVLGVLDTNRLG